jgi:nucleotide-binding universal stress UspA family protein
MSAKKVTKKTGRKLAKKPAKKTGRKPAKKTGRKPARKTASKPEKRFRICVCIDGSDECYQSLRYAARLGGADIILLYVRPVDQGLRSGGLQVRVARENMLKWGLELPGLQYLKKGRDMLKDLDIMSGDDWIEEHAHTDVDGDPLGDNKINYVNSQGKMVVLKLKVATDIATGILEQWELGEYDLIILGASGRWSGMARTLWDPGAPDLHRRVRSVYGNGLQGWRIGEPLRLPGVPDERGARRGRGRRSQGQCRRRQGDAENNGDQGEKNSR